MHRSFRWQEVEKLLGVRIACLPQTIRCPGCGSTSCRVYQTNDAGSDLHHCNRCEAHGDVVDFFAETWKVDADLARTMLIAAVEKSACSQPSQATAQRFWSQASRTAAEGGDEYNTLKFLGVRMGEPDAWEKYLHKSMGISSRREARAAFRRETPEETPDALVVPWWLNETRISGLTVFSRNGQETVESSPTEDGGLAFLPHAMNAGVVVGVGDLRVAAELHVKQARLSYNPLAVVGWRRRTVTAWEAFQGLRIVIWSPTKDADDFVHAARLGCDMSIVGWREHQQRNYLRRKTAEEARRTVIANAKPWQEAFKAWTEKLDDIQLSEFVVRVMEAVPLDEFTKTLDRRTADKLASFAPRQSKIRRSTVGSREFVQTPAGIFLQRDRGRELVFDGEIDVEGNDGVSVWGCIRRGGSSVKFKVNASQKAGARWLRRTLKKAGLDDDVYIKSSCGGSLLKAAIDFA